MDIILEPGLYVAAVSGGVDSMVLLHLLYHKNETSKDSPWRLVVAHFDHGMRDDSVVDRQLVQATAQKYGLPFIYDRTELGAGASEDIARRARYGFLHKVRASSGAKAVITAQHQDDLLETAMLNLLRGTGRRGVTSLKSTDVIKRPLLHLTKRDLIAYALKHNLKWREDSTNTDPRYLRNHLRNNILPGARDVHKEEFLQIIKDLGELNDLIDNELKILRIALMMKNNEQHIDRAKFITLPHKVALEIMLDWLRSYEVRDITRPVLEKLVVAAKTLRPGKRIQIDKHTTLSVDKDSLSLVQGS